MEIIITKYRPSINWFMLILATSIIANTILQIILIILYSFEVKFVMGIAISAMGLVLFAFLFIIEDQRIIYNKRYKTYFKIKDLKGSGKDQPLSRTFITAEGTILE